MLKRLGFMFMVNIGVLITISITLKVLGIGQYITQNGLDYQTLAIFCFAWGIAGSFISLALSKFVAKKFMGVKAIDPYGPYAILQQKIHTFASSAGLTTMPEVGIYQSPEINAFTTGSSADNSLVALSSGVLSNLSEDELDGVLAHEIAHIANGDMVTMSLLQGIINAFVFFFARVAAFVLGKFLRGDKDKENVNNYSDGGGIAYLISVFIFEVLFGFLAKFIVSYFSRIREFKADTEGAKLAGEEKMIAALKALQANYESISVTTDNMKSVKISSTESFMDLLASHPPLQERINALENRGEN